MNRVDGCPMCEAYDEWHKVNPEDQAPEERPCPMCDVGVVVKALRRADMPRDLVINMIAEIVRLVYPDDKKIVDAFGRKLH